MQITLDQYQPRQSLSGMIFVAAIHLALLIGLLYGLKTVSVTLPHEKDLIVHAIPPDRPVTVEIKPREIPVNLISLPTPVIPPPPIQTDIHDIMIDDYHGTRPAAGGGSGEGSGDGTVSKPADVFVAALVDAKSCDKPAYPSNALRNGDTGIVTLALLIGPDGKVADSRIAQSSGHRDLDKAAVAGLSLCRFKPATLNGQPQKSWATLQYAWSLDS